MTDVQWVFHDILIRKKEAEILDREYKAGLLQVEEIAHIMEQFIPIWIEGGEQTSQRLDSYQEMDKTRRQRLFNILTGEDLDPAKGSEEGSNSKDDKPEDISIDQLDLSDDKKVKEFMDKNYEPMPKEIRVPKAVFKKQKPVLKTFRRDSLKQEMRFQDIADEVCSNGEDEKFVLRRRESSLRKPKTGKAGIFMGEEDEIETQ